jgi:glycosyltransferase involved in cell wall biosynthesis
MTAAWLAGAHRHLPIVASRRVAYPLQNHPLALARYHAARRILAVSHFVAETVIASGISPDHVEVVYDGVEVPPLPSPELRRLARERWGASEGVTLLGCVGYFLPEKGQQFLIRALPALREHNNSCRLLLAGDGPCRERLERLVRQLGLESAVHFAGVVEDVSEVYAALDVFVLPSLAEPLGSSLLTAMAHGMPVVAAASGGVPEYIEHGRNGLLVAVQPKAEYARTLARALMRLLREPDTARRLGAAAREMIAARFTAERMVEETLRVYQEARAEGAWR